MLYTRLNIAALGEPARDWRWRAVLPSITSNSEDSGILSSIKSAVSGFVNDVVAESISFPHNSIESKQRQKSGTYTNVPGFVTSSNLGVVLYETDDYRTTQYLYKWQEKIVSKDGTYSMPGFFKKDILLQLFDATNILRPTLTLRARNAWPSDIHTFDLNYTNEGFLTVGVTFSVDPPIEIESSNISLSTSNLIANLLT